MNCPKCGREISWHSINENLELFLNCSYISVDIACLECGEEIEILYLPRMIKSE